MWSQFKDIFRTFAYIWKTLTTKHRSALTFATMIMIAAGVLSNVPPLILGQLVDSLMKQSIVTSHSSVSLIIVLALAIVIREGLQVVRKYLVENTCTEVEKRSSLKLIDHILRLDLDCLSLDMKSGALNSRIHRSVEGVVRLLKLSFLDFVPMVLTAVCSFFIILLKNPWMSVLMCLVVPFGFLIILRQLHTQRGIRLNLLRIKEERDGRVVELLQGVEFVRTSCTESVEVEKMGIVSEDLRGTEITHHLRMAVYDAGKSLNEGFFFILTMSVSVFLANAKLITPGDILMFALIFGNIVTPLREIHRIVDEAHESSIKVADFIDLMEKPVDKSYAVACGLPLSLTKNHPHIPHIEIKGLSFKYSGSNGNGPTLKNINLSIARGQRIGIAGPSGSGKSTWIKLLLSLYHPYAGSIIINGLPLSSMTRKDIASEFGYVSQTPFLFSGSIEENIKYGCDDVSHEEIVAATIKANIHNEILSMEQGYQSRVAERGQNLSGGQRQRIAIARVFLKNPQVLLFDEATSSLDNSNEKIVQAALLDAMEGRTVIMVAHRLSTLKYADRIIVFKDGQIVETGTFDDLVENDGLFSKLYSAAN
jgi:ATP-binding cassette, subfamily B, bacterial